MPNSVHWKGFLWEIFYSSKQPESPNCNEVKSSEFSKPLCIENKDIGDKKKYTKLRLLIIYYSSDSFS